MKLFNKAKNNVPNYYEVKSKTVTKTIIITLIASTLYLCICHFTEDPLITDFIKLIYIPLFLLFVTPTINNAPTTLSLAEENEKLYRFGIISNEEYEYRKKALIDVENEKVKNHHNKSSTDYKKYLKS